jgi:superfamily II DNA/RNA helicase
MQAGAVPKVLHDRRNLVIAAPTGSGKTLVAETALLQEALDRDGAGVYLAPMRAIASEKRDEWQRLEAAGIRVYKTTGEDDAFDPVQARQAQVIVATPEKWDSVSRRQLPPELVARIGTIVIDEVHLVDDDRRGPGLEALLARIHLAFPAARLLAMSGTLANADAVARWLQADLHESTWRPVSLTTVVVPYPRPSTRREDDDLRNGLAAQIAGETLEDDGALLVFCGSRKGVESCAAHLAQALARTPVEIRRQIQSAELRKVLASGVGFHHAGLARSDRALVEDLFRSGAIKVLVATSTMAAGVNLPARVVVVRDLTLGVDDIDSSDLLQMAGRAGRPGREREGRCFVLSPTDRVAGVQAMLDGRPIGSHIADDLPTHLNTEIVLGIVRSQADAEAWYQRTLHAHLGGPAVDPMSAVAELIRGGFASERDGVLEPTPLGRSTSDGMISVASAATLDAWLGERTLRSADPVAVELELLSAACGLPKELADIPSRADEAERYADIKRALPSAGFWSQGRLRYLAVACSLLSGARSEDLPIEFGPSVAAAVQSELPRFLRFLSRRAHERTMPAPDVAVAAADLATTLEYGVAERGAGPLLEALKWGHRPDETRRRKVLQDYASLRARGVESLQGATVYVADPVRRSIEHRPVLEPSLEVENGSILLHAGRSVRPARLHVRIATDQREVLHTAEQAHLDTVELGPANQLGSEGVHRFAVELVARTSGGTAWAYAADGGEVDVPPPAIDLGGADRALRDRGATEYESTPSRGMLGKLGRAIFGTSALDDAQHQLEEVPARVKKAATILARGLATPAEKADSVARLLRKRQPADSTLKPRSLVQIADSLDLTTFEAGLLATALLRCMGVEAHLQRATVDGQESALCTWRSGDKLYGLPIWPAGSSVVHGVRVEAWTDDAHQTPLPFVGWEVLANYQTIAARRLPFGLTEARPFADRRNGVAEPPASHPRSTSSPAQPQLVPICPLCRAPMRRRGGRYGEFWGCSCYPSCRGTRQG